MQYATIMSPHAIDKFWIADLDVNLSMNANKMWCKSRLLSLIQMLPGKDANAISMMQMSHAGMEMQSLFMMMPVHAFKTQCNCLLTEVEMRMSSNRYVMMQMSFCRNAMMQMPWCKHNLFKNSLCFQNQGFLIAWNQKYFQILICYFLKSHLVFDLRLPKIGDHC